MATRRVFISHTSSDRSFAQELSDDLRSKGADVWLDTTHMGPGDFVANINRALQERDVLLLILSPAAIASPWVQQEMNASITRANQGLMYPPMVVQSEQVSLGELPPLWTIYHRYDATSSKGYAEMLRAVSKELHLGPGINRSGQATAATTNSARRATEVSFKAAVADERVRQEVIGIGLSSRLRVFAIGLALVVILALIANFALGHVLGTGLGNQPTSTSTPSYLITKLDFPLAYSRVAVVRVLTYYYGSVSGVPVPTPAPNPCMSDGILIGTTGSNLNSLNCVLVPAVGVNPATPCQGAQTSFVQLYGTASTWEISHIDACFSVAYMGTSDTRCDTTPFASIDPSQIPADISSRGQSLVALSLQLASGVSGVN